MNQAPHVAIVGATGAVGVEILSSLETRNFPVGSLKLLASARSAGKQVAFRGKMLTVEELTEKSFDGVDIALFSAGGGISLKFAPVAAAAGCVVIDNSSAFRQEPDVPLVVPEINPEAAFNHPRNIIANPNCTTIITLMALFPLHQRFGLKTVIASSYQAVSGSGQHGIAELEAQVRAVVDGHPVVKNVYPHQIAFNLLPQIDSFAENGYTKEELKMLNEGRKILSLPELKVTCTCVRVPVYRSHSIAVTAQFEKPVDVETARSAYDGQPCGGRVAYPAGQHQRRHLLRGAHAHGHGDRQCPDPLGRGRPGPERGRTQRRTNRGIAGQPLNRFLPRTYPITPCVNNL